MGPTARSRRFRRRLPGCPGRVGQVRAGGYVFEPTLENQVNELAQSWANSYANLSQQLALQGPDLEWSYNTLASEAQQLSQMAAMNPAAAQGALFQGRSTLESFKMRLGAVEKSLADGYGPFEGQLDPIVHLLDRIDWSLAQAAQAQFAWQAGEAPIMAVKAQWQRGGKDEPEGVLYLTDQRALFEQKQEIATKKILFVATQKQMVQQLLWQASLGEVQNVTAGKRGLFKNEDHLEITAAGSGLAHFHLPRPGLRAMVRDDGPRAGRRLRRRPGAGRICAASGGTGRREHRLTIEREDGFSRGLFHGPAEVHNSRIQHRSPRLPTGSSALGLRRRLEQALRIGAERARPVRQGVNKGEPGGRRGADERDVAQARQALLDGIRPGIPPFPALPVHGGQVQGPGMGAQCPQAVHVEEDFEVRHHQLAQAAIYRLAGA